VGFGPVAHGLGGNFSKTVAVGNIYNGMAPDTPSYPPRPNERIARTQWYFVDACRVYPAGTPAPDVNDPCSTVFPPTKPGRDDRKAPIFYATVPGGKAAGFDLDETAFTRGLLRCLGGAGGEHKVLPTWATQWRVSSHSLSGAMAAVLADMQLTGRPPQECRIHGQTPDVVFCTLPGPPNVAVTVHVDPDTAHAVTRIELSPGGGEPGTPFAPKDTPVPHHRLEVPPGRYELSAWAGPPYANFGPRWLAVEPPLIRMNVKVSP
jgi:hypothetical protein